MNARYHKDKRLCWANGPFKRYNRMEYLTYHHLRLLRDFGCYVIIFGLMVETSSEPEEATRPNP
jgi:hypothetical protein